MVLRNLLIKYINWIKHATKTSCDGGSCHRNIPKHN